jgi:hypothetical protein
MYFAGTAGLGARAFSGTNQSTRLLLGAVLFVSLALTYLSASAWFRITKTFMTGLWNYWRFMAPSELATACLRDASGCVRQPDTRQPSIDAGAC